VYGGSTVLYKNGQLLHAKELVLAHPITKESMHFEADLPEYFEKVLEKLRNQQK
jgi:23S rRNA pseudouridine1911/1915/1917 synthase